MILPALEFAVIPLHPSSTPQRFDFTPAPCQHGLLLK
jgi:hypothetical protein